MGMEFMGREATVVIEVDMGKDRVLRVPVGDLALYQPAAPDASYGTLTMVIREPLIRALRDAVRGVQEVTGP